MSNFVKIRPVGAELFHADRRTDTHNEPNSRFRNFANAPKKDEKNRSPAVRSRGNFSETSLTKYALTQPKGQ